MVILSRLERAIKDEQLGIEIVLAELGYTDLHLIAEKYTAKDGSFDQIKFYPEALVKAVKKWNLEEEGDKGKVITKPITLKSMVSIRDNHASLWKLMCEEFDNLHDEINLRAKEAAFQKRFLSGIHSKLKGMTVEEFKDFQKSLKTSDTSGK